MGSFYYCYLQFLLWPPAYKSRCQVSLEFILLHSESLLFPLLPQTLSCYVPTVSALDTGSVRCLWPDFTSCPAGSCVFGSGGQEWCPDWLWRLGTHPCPVGILGWVSVCTRGGCPCELWRYNLVEWIYSLVKTQLKLSLPRENKTSDYWSCHWAFSVCFLNHSLGNRYPVGHRLAFI